MKLGRMGLEKTADCKKYNAQRHGRRIGSENDAPISTDRKRHAIPLIEPPDRDFKFSFPAPALDGIADGSSLLSAHNTDFGHDVDEAVVETITRETRRWLEQVGEATLNAVMPPLPPTSPAQSLLLFANVGLTVRVGDAIGTVGVNGGGKSTLLKLLCGEVERSVGVVKVPSDARVGYFSQHLVDQLDIRRLLSDSCCPSHQP